MELQAIEALLKKYELGETSKAEETQLALFFKSSSVPEHLEHYRSLFDYFYNSRQQQYTTKLNFKSTYFEFKRLSVAASVIILLGLILNYNLKLKNKQYSEEELFVYDQTKTALEMLSTNFNKGTSQLKSLEILSKTLQKGEENISFLNTFNTTTRKIFKINK